MAIGVTMKESTGLRRKGETDFTCQSRIHGKTESLVTSASSVGVTIHVEV